jgi:tetratricopeptide (TPR) repeat protein
LHDLIRAFARERLAAEDLPAEQNAALERALGALLYLAEEAYRGYFGGEYLWIPSNAQRWPLPKQLVEKLVSDPLSWYETERAALVAGVRQAAQADLTETCWGLAFSAVPLFESRIYLDDWQETHDIALAAARKAHHVHGEAAMRYSIGELHIIRRQAGQARQDCLAAAQLFQETGDEHGRALATRYIALMDRLSGRLDDAARFYSQALGVFRKTGDQIALGHVLQDLAAIELDRGEPGAAKELLSEALRSARAGSYARFEAQVLHRMGDACLMSGDLDDAIDAFRSALLLVPDIGDLIGEAYILRGIGATQVRQGELGPASEALRRAADLAVITGDRLVEAQALRGLSELALTSGDPGQAVAHAQQAATISRSIDTPLEQARALTLLSDAHAADGDAEAAGAAAAQAAAIHARLLGDAEA